MGKQMGCIHMHPTYAHMQNDPGTPARRSSLSMGAARVLMSKEQQLEQCPPMEMDETSGERKRCVRCDECVHGLRMTVGHPRSLTIAKHMFPSFIAGRPSSAATPARRSTPTAWR